jgi:hypothetical protein
MRHSLIIAIFAISFAPCIAQEAVETLVATSQPRIQTQIQETYDALLSIHSGDSKESAVSKELEQLKSSSEDKSEIVKQLAIFSMSVESGEHVLLVRIMLNSLDLPPKEVIRALAPYIDAENENLQSFVKDWFKSHDEHGAGPSSLMSLNYRDYLDYVQGNLARHEETPAGFIEYIFQKSPDQALQIFLRANPRRRAETIARLQEIGKQVNARRKLQAVEGIPPMPRPREVKPEDLAALEQPKIDAREIRLAEVIIGNAIRLKGFDEQFEEALPDAKDQLVKLAENHEWWARLYVVEIMRRHRELRLPDVLEKLSEDKNALVSKVAIAIKPQVPK